MDRSVPAGGVWEGIFGARSATQTPARPAADAAGGDIRRPADERLARLARAIEHEIIPRLMLTHRLEPACPAAPIARDRLIGEQDVQHFARLVLEAGDELPLACVAELRERGVAVESLYLDLLAPTARYLGQLWEDDLCDFTEVTIGLGRLQQVLRQLSGAFDPGHEHAEGGRRVLLLPSPGEQHTFGLVMVAEFFRRAGWLVAGGPADTALEAETRVHAEWFDVVGFSLAAERHADALAASIAAVRRNSRNPAVGIIVGGPMFTTQPQYMVKVGADALARDGREAPVIAEQLIKERGKPC